MIEKTLMKENTHLLVVAVVVLQAAQDLKTHQTDASLIGTREALPTHIPPGTQTGTTTQTLVLIENFLLPPITPLRVVLTVEEANTMMVNLVQGYQHKIGRKL